MKNLIFSLIIIGYSTLLFNIFPLNNISQNKIDDTTFTVKTNSNGNRVYSFKGVTFEMVPVKGGTFTMGSTSEQGDDYYEDEKPTHRVTVSDYYIGKFEVTQELWEAVMDTNQSFFKGKKLPVENVSWVDVQEFLTKLNEISGENFRLPTEAEWEFAARGGNKSRGYKYCGSSGINDVAWYTMNSGYKTHPVGQKSPNELGLYDMSGNVWEWCQDWYDTYSEDSQINPNGASKGLTRVLRGGGWLISSRSCRVSMRSSYNPIRTYNDTGFRLALSFKDK